MANPASEILLGIINAGRSVGNASRLALVSVGTGIYNGGVASMQAMNRGRLATIDFTVTCWRYIKRDTSIIYKLNKNWLGIIPKSDEDKKNVPTDEQIDSIHPAEYFAFLLAISIPLFIKTFFINPFYAMRRQFMNRLNNIEQLYFKKNPRPEYNLYAWSDDNDNITFASFLFGNLFAAIPILISWGILTVVKSILETFKGFVNFCHSVMKPLWPLTSKKPTKIKGVLNTLFATPGYLLGLVISPALLTLCWFKAGMESLFKANKWLFNTFASVKKRSFEDSEISKAPDVQLSDSPVPPPKNQYGLSFVLGLLFPLNWILVPVTLAFQTLVKFTWDNFQGLFAGLSWAKHYLWSSSTGKDSAYEKFKRQDMSTTMGNFAWWIYDAEKRFTLGRLITGILKTLYTLPGILTGAALGTALLGGMRVLAEGWHNFVSIHNWNARQLTTSLIIKATLRPRCVKDQQIGILSIPAWGFIIVDSLIINGITIAWMNIRASFETFQFHIRKFLLPASHYADASAQLDVPKAYAFGFYEDLRINGPFDFRAIFKAILSSPGMALGTMVGFPFAVTGRYIYEGVVRGLDSLQYARRVTCQPWRNQNTKYKGDEGIIAETETKISTRWPKLTAVMGFANPIFLIPFTLHVTGLTLRETLRGFINGANGDLIEHHWQAPRGMPNAGWIVAGLALPIGLYFFAGIVSVNVLTAAALLAGLSGYIGIRHFFKPALYTDVIWDRVIKHTLLPVAAGTVAIIAVPFTATYKVLKKAWKKAWGTERHVLAQYHGDNQEYANSHRKMLNLFDTLLSKAAPRKEDWKFSNKKDPKSLSEMVRATNQKMLGREPSLEYSQSALDTLESMYQRAETSPGTDTNAKEILFNCFILNRYSSERTAVLMLRNLYLLYITGHATVDTHEETNADGETVEKRSLMIDSTDTLSEPLGENIKQDPATFFAAVKDELKQWGPQPTAPAFTSLISTMGVFRDSDDRNQNAYEMLRHLGDMPEPSAPPHSEAGTPRSNTSV